VGFLFFGVVVVVVAVFFFRFFGAITSTVQGRVTPNLSLISVDVSVAGVAGWLLVVVVVGNKNSS